MLQQDEPDDFVVATGETHSIRDLLDTAFRRVGIEDWAAARRAGPAVLPSRRGGPADRGRQQGAGEAGVEADHDLRGAHRADGRRRPGDRAQGRPARGRLRPGVAAAALVGAAGGHGRHLGGGRRRGRAPGVAVALRARLLAGRAAAAPVDARPVDRRAAGTAAVRPVGAARLAGRAARGAGAQRRRRAGDAAAAAAVRLRRAGADRAARPDPARPGGRAGRRRALRVVDEAGGVLRRVQAVLGGRLLGAADPAARLPGRARPRAAAAGRPGAGGGRAPSGSGSAIRPGW